MPNLVDLVIFDCDGVLVDSEVISSRIFRDCLAELGVMLTLEEAVTFGIGKSSTTFAAATEQEFGITWEDAKKIVRGGIAGLTEPLAPLVNVLRNEFEAALEALRQELKAEMRASENANLKATVAKLGDLAKRVEVLSLHPVTIDDQPARPN